MFAYLFICVMYLPTREETYDTTMKVMTINTLPMCLFIRTLGGTLVCASGCGVLESIVFNVFATVVRMKWKLQLVSAASCSK